MHLLFMAAALCAVQEPAAPTGPVAYYKLDEPNTAGVAVDTMGGSSGTYVGPPTVSTGVPPAITYVNPNCLDLNGTGQCVRVDSFGSFDKFTVSVWIYRTGATAQRESIVSYKEGNGVNKGFVLCLNDAGNTQYPRIFVQVNGTWRYAESATAVPLNTWTHIAASYDGTDIKLYVDGVLVATANWPGAMTNDQDQYCVIGARADSTSNFFPGRIDDVRFYDHALSLNEIGVLAAGCPEPGPLMATSPAVGQVDLTWTAPAGPAVTYTYRVKRRPAGSGSPYVTIATVSGLTYTDNVGYPYAAQDYEVTAISIAESGGAGTTIQPMQPPPRTQKLGSRHMCGFSTVGSPGVSALGAAAVTLLLLSLRRKC